MVSDPPGLLMVTPTGELQQIIVLSAAECDAQATYAELHNAPATVVERLHTRTHLGFFMEDPESYGVDDEYPWSELMHRATPLGDSEQKWFAACCPGSAATDKHRLSARLCLSGSLAAIA